MSDLQEYEDMKRKKKELAKQSGKGSTLLEQRAVHRIMNDPVAKRSPRKALTFDVSTNSATTPARTSTPEED